MRMGVLNRLLEASIMRFRKSDDDVYVEGFLAH